MASDTNDKILKTYELVAQLLNSGKESNIDRAYSALISASEQKYRDNLSDISASYTEKRNTAARSKAMGDKYLNYFMTEKGYAGSGIEADSKVKSALNYQSGLSALQLAEQNESKEAKKYRDSQILELETKRAKEKADYEEALYDKLYQAQRDEKEDAYREKQLALEEQSAKEAAYWKQKEYELKKQQTGSSTSDKTEYNTKAYQEILKKLDQCRNLDEVNRLYASITGENFESAEKALGSSGYYAAVKQISDRVREMQTQTEEEQKEEELYQALKNYTDGNITDRYMEYRNKIKSGDETRYTLEQLNRAYDRYLKEQR